MRARLYRWHSDGECLSPCPGTFTWMWFAFATEAAMQLRLKDRASLRLLHGARRRRRTQDLVRARLCRWHSGGECLLPRPSAPAPARRWFAFATEAVMQLRLKDRASLRLLHDARRRPTQGLSKHLLDDRSRCLVFVPAFSAQFRAISTRGPPYDVSTTVCGHLSIRLDVAYMRGELYRQT